VTEIILFNHSHKQKDFSGKRLLRDLKKRWTSRLQFQKNTPRVHKINFSTILLIHGKKHLEKNLWRQLRSLNATPAQTTFATGVFWRHGKQNNNT